MLALGLALVLGTAAARRPDSRLDDAINLFCFAGISMPTFWLALVLILVFAAGLGWLPASGIATAGAGDVGDRLRHLVLPVATLTLASVGGYTRYHARRDARGAGAGPHPHRPRQRGERGAGRVAPCAAHGAGAGDDDPGAVVRRPGSGALVTETMFAYPGMGKLIFDAVMGNDYNLALAALLLAAVTTMLANLGADLAYAWLDPRVSYR